MSYDELELDKLGDEKTALFFLISDTDSTYNFIVALAYSYLFMASLGVSFKPVRLAVPVTRQGVLSRTNLTPPHVPRTWRSWHFYHVCI